MNKNKSRNTLLFFSRVDYKNVKVDIQYTFLSIVNIYFVEIIKILFQYANINVSSTSRNVKTNIQSLMVNTAAAGLFIDFQAAFNQLWFSDLMLKLSRLDCPWYLVTWLITYLSERSTFISMNGTTSSTFSLYKGVPQGSCIGPVIFIVYHHDILNSVSMLHWGYLFADDLAIFVSSSANWSSRFLTPNLIEQIKDVISQLMSYSLMWK
jgi:hypothetical protein